MRRRKLIELRYRLLWYIGALVSLLLHFSGLVHLYIYLRKRILKHYITVVLMYHRINDGRDDRDISVSPEKFERQIKYLKENFEVISVDELVDRLKHGYKPRKDAVVITFDDGYKDNYTNGYPILKRYGIPSAIFLVAGLIDKHPMLLSSSDIIKMQKGNIIFGAHTVTHKVLSEVSRDAAISEIKDSKIALEEILKKEVKYFAYPYGKKERDFTDETAAVVKEIGYCAAFSTDNGYIDENSNIFALQRIGMRDFPLFVLKVRTSGIFENRLFYLLRRLTKL